MQMFSILKSQLGICLQMLIFTFNFYFPLHLWVYLGFQDDSYIRTCIHVYTVYIFPFAGLPDSWLYNTIVLGNSVLTTVRAGTALPPPPPTIFSSSPQVRMDLSSPLKISFTTLLQHFFPYI